MNICENGSNVQLKIFGFPILMIYEKFEYFLWFQSVILKTYNLFMICLNDRDSRLMKHHKLSRNAIFSWKIMKKTCILRFMHCVACQKCFLFSEYPRISQLMVSRIVIVLHILLPVIPVVFSLQCYNCTSHHHPDCLAYWKVEDDERYQKYIITCDSDDDLCTQKTGIE